MPLKKVAGERFRAVLMTAMTFILGVFPMIVATGAGASSQIAIGSSVFYGMIAATFIGIIFIPALFAVFETIKEWAGHGREEDKIIAETREHGSPLGITLDEGEENGRNKRLTALLAFTLLTSCTVGPDYQRPKFFNDAEVAKNLKLEQANASPVYHDWYKQFNDPALDGLIEQAWASSPNVKIAVHKLRQARYALRSSNMQSFPMFDIDTGYNYEKTGKDTGFSIKRDYYQLGMDASWELDIWGGNRRVKEASAAVFKAAGANLDNVRLVMAGEVANNYINLRTNQEQLRVAKQNLKLQQDIYELVKQKYEAGLTDFIALNQSQYAVESTKTLIPQLETNIEAYKKCNSCVAGRSAG